jgi:ribosomal protein S21
MLSIKLKYNDNPVRAFQKMKQLVSQEDLMMTLKNNQSYKKPSAAKRAKRKEAARQRVKDNRKRIQQAIRLEQQMWE